MANVLLFVVGTEIINGDEFLIAEPIVSTTGIQNDQSDFSGELYAITAQGSQAIGCKGLLLTLFEEHGMRWKFDGGCAPKGAFFLSDDAELQIGFDQVVDWKPTDLILHRLGMVEWRAYPVEIGNRQGVICPIPNVEIGKNRLIILDGENDLSGNLELTEIDDQEEVLGHVRISIEPAA